MNACLYGNFELAQWLWSLNLNITSISNNRVIFSNIDMIQWLISIGVKLDINFKSQYNEIKDLLIGVIDPSTLELEDLQYYLAHTNNVVPKGFKNKYNLKVSERGTRTKPAPHN